jgi:hypothetical protein
MTERGAGVEVEQDEAVPDPDGGTAVADPVRTAERVGTAEPASAAEEADLPTDALGTDALGDPETGVPGEAAGPPSEPPGPVKVDEAEAEEAAAPAAEETPDAEEVWGHFAPEPERAPSRLRLVAQRAGRFLVHEWTLATLGAIVLAVVMTWPTVLHPSTTIPADIWDPTLQAWQIAWAGHAVLHDPAHLWNANAFYPDLYSYTFSDTLFGYFPAGLIGTGPGAALVRYNVMFVLLHVLAFLGPYALVRQLGARRTAAAVAGVAFAYAPWRWGQAGHMHVLSDGGIPLALAMLARGHGYSFVHRFRRELVKPWWAFAGWCLVAWQISLGFGIGLPFAYVLGLICLVVAVRWLVRFLRDRPVPTWRVLLADGLGLLVFGAVAAFMARPYLEVVKLHPEAKRSVEDLKVFSPNLRAFITAPAQSWLWGDAHEAVRATMTAPAETTLLPGFMLIGLAAAGLFFSTWRLATRLWLLAGVVVGLVFAMGTEFFGGRFTYVPLFEHAPGWEGIRTPGRLVIWVTLLLAVLAAGATSALLGRSYELAAQRVPYRPSLAVRLATLIPLVLVLVEGVNKLDHPVVPTQPAAMRTATGPMIVLPSDQLTDENVMIWSTTRFQPMVNGGSGFYPIDQTATRDAVKSFPDQASVDYLRRLGVKTVIVLKARVGGTDYARAASLDVPIDGLGITRKDDGDTVLYTLG